MPPKVDSSISAFEKAKEKQAKLQAQLDKVKKQVVDTKMQVARDAKAKNKN